MGPAATPGTMRSSEEIDLVLSQLREGLRCLCCPAPGLFTRLLDPADGTAPPPGARRPLTRADFTGLLPSHHIDDGAAGPV